MSQREIEFLLEILSIPTNDVQNLHKIITAAGDFMGLDGIAVQNKQGRNIVAIGELSTVTGMIKLNHDTKLIYNSMQALSDSDLHFLNAIANHINTFLAHIDFQQRLDEERYQHEIANTLQDISYILTGELELKTVLNKILGQVARVLPYDAASIWFKKEGENYIQAITSVGYEKFGIVEDVAQATYQITEDSLVKEIASTKRAIIIPDVSLEPRWKLSESYPWIKSWASAPIIVNDQFIGQFNIDHAQKNFYDEHLRGIIDTFTRQMNIAVQNAYLYEALRHSQDELRESLEREKELSILKSRFISMISHEFRTPLSTILTNTSLLKHSKNRLSPEKKNSTFETIKKQVHYLDQLVEEVLLVSKGDAVGFQLNIDSHHFNQYCDNMMNEMRVIAQDEINLNLVLSGQCKDFAFDSKLMQHILTNLLSNAIKYSSEGGTVTLNVSCDETHINLSVSDEGIGIPKEEQDKLFQHFFRASNTVDIPGTGVGLTIIKRAVEAYKGEISFDSQVQEGTTFAVKLPRHDTIPDEK